MKPETFRGDAAECSLIVSHLSTSYNLVKLSSFLGKFRTGLIIISDSTSHSSPQASLSWTKTRAQLGQSEAGGRSHSQMFSAENSNYCVDNQRQGLAGGFLFSNPMMTLDVKTKTL